MADDEEKRLFFGFEVEAPWFKFPRARLLDESHRHMTIAFLGNTSFAKVQGFLSEFPNPSFSVGCVGILDRCLFLPPHHPRAIAYHFESICSEDPLLPYQKEVANFLTRKGYDLDKRDFLPHVTLGRSPFNKEEWEKAFTPLPAFYQSFHLYESLGNLHYQPIWSIPLKAPFQEIEHIADIAFNIVGKTVQEIHLHAQIALCFECPELLSYLEFENLKGSLEEVIMHLNEIVTQADQEIGTPFKAVSFHGELKKTDLLEWEMIVDV